VSRNPLADWMTSLQIPCLFALMMSFAFVRNLALVPLAMIISAVLFACSGMPVTSACKWLRIPLTMLMFMTVLIIMLDGTTVLISVGPLAVRAEGVELAAVIWGRVLSILGVAMALYHTAGGWELAAGLRRCGVPGMLIDMGMLTGRYIQVTAQEYGRMRIAMRLRGERSMCGLMRLSGTPVSLAGSLLVRGFEQADRIFNAMKLRGYSGKVSHGGEGGGRRPVSSHDVLMSLSVTAAAAALVLLELHSRGAV
jgi:cobalt/nickel transport system permease protein